MSATSLERDAQEVKNNDDFQKLPLTLRSWILASPNAVSDFAGFFRNGGEFDMSQEVGLPAYFPRDPPFIAFDRNEWENIQKHGPTEYGLLRMFGTLAHEIGHDRFNTGVTPFAGGSKDDYVAYRSRLEAEAIFNAFPIFRDLREEPAFKSAMPFNSIGYLQGIELAQLYRQWDRGELDREQVVARIAARVADTPYTRPHPPPDENGDGRSTHRDAYLHDYRRYIDKTPQPAAPSGSNSSAAPTSPATLNDPADRAAFERIRDAAAATGRWPSQQCENIAAAGLLAFKRDPACQRLDQIAFGAPGSAGENQAFLMYSPFGDREPRFHVRVDAETAARQPAAAALAQLPPSAPTQTPELKEPNLQEPNAPEQGPRLSLRAG
ncbi:hypothetical protein [Lysobacter enzymogenes]|uniref:hypothetical protein n=1 Tax=Lysobacter enzymogenes TaxID=69 RepID=UPI000896E3AC|nr:hypothetical protein [Lysobacter enzymogenes]SDY05745.1 hypothetical protein SAMN05421681_110103 [Lysobacter enzymogenes]